MMHSPIKDCIELLSARFTKQKFEDIASDIASQCRTALTQRVIGKSKILPPKQFRGYIRAFAACSIESIINERSDLKRLNSSQISKVMLQAKEILIEMVIGDRAIDAPHSCGRHRRRGLNLS